jgi:hypothetical protein
MHGVVALENDPVHTKASHLAQVGVKTERGSGECY